MIQFWKYKCINKYFSSVWWQVLSYIADVMEMIKKMIYKYLQYWWSGLPAKILFYIFTVFLFFLFSALLDLVEAPGAFIMGCHAQHKKQVQRVAEAMDEVIHPIMFFCSSTIEQGDKIVFVGTIWTALSRKYFQNNTEGIVGGWSYLHRKNWWPCVFRSWKSGFWFWIPCRIRK